MRRLTPLAHKVLSLANDLARVEGHLAIDKRHVCRGVEMVLAGTESVADVDVATATPYRDEAPLEFAEDIQTLLRGPGRAVTIGDLAGHCRADGC